MNSFRGSKYVHHKHMSDDLVTTQDVLTMLNFRMHLGESTYRGHTVTSIAMKCYTFKETSN